ncbi:MAG: cytochrome c maturation protein CcmE [Dehalococcoidales bacterium]|nr:cytochrome c maturation protein CcmE [Dehalococcoidales bacterium]
MMKKRLLIGGGIILIAVIYLLYLSFGSSVSYYVTVSEFYDRTDELLDTSIRVAGNVAENSIEWNAKEVELAFVLTEGGRDMPVVYHGAQPSGFKGGSTILVEGEYESDGVFQASQLILKCPSKYESIDIE